jgi:hypothetical protein
MIRGFFVAAPSVVRKGEKFSLGIKVLGDVYDCPSTCYYLNQTVPQQSGRFNLSPRGIRFKDNVLPDWEGTVAIKGDEGYDGPSEYSFADGRGTFEGDTRPIVKISGLSFDQPGFHFLTVSEPSSGVSSMSNPIFVCEEEPEERLFWGDLHCHSFFSDGLVAQRSSIHSQGTNLSSTSLRWLTMLKA